MKNRARIPYYLRKQVYRWTRNLNHVHLKAIIALDMCSGTRHVWVSKADEPQPDERCLCGKHVYGVSKP